MVFHVNPMQVAQEWQVDSFVRKRVQAPLHKVGELPHVEHVKQVPEVPLHDTGFIEAETKPVGVRRNSQPTAAEYAQRPAAVPSLDHRSSITADHR